MPRKPDKGPMSAQFNLGKFTVDLIGDLQALRKGEISVREAHARADLAKQVLRSVHYVVLAQKFIDGQAKPLPTIQAERRD